jgi:hypothetical protein
MHDQLDNQILLISGLDKNGPYSLDYYISGTDSCKGDSGGGLYTWRDGAPTLMGVVSRYSDKRPTLMGVVSRYSDKRPRLMDVVSRYTRDPRLWM